MDNNSLSQQQLAIPQSLYRFRFLTSTQIQKLLHFKTLHVTNYHLNILTKLGYINKHYSRTLGLANQPAVYFLAPRSIKVLENTEGITARGLKRIYREKIRSPQLTRLASASSSRLRPRRATRPGLASSSASAANTAATPTP